MDSLSEVEGRVRNKISEEDGRNLNSTGTSQADTLVFPVHFFEGIYEFKKLVHSLNDKFHQLIGDTRILFAMKKGSSLGNIVVRNKQLSIVNLNGDSQKCNGRGCLQCPLSNNKSKIIVNDQVVRVPRNLNCRSKNVIYLWLCKLCEEREAYFG